MSTEAWHILLTAGFIATSCALLGSFLILRKMAMVGDAISHAVLPGIVIAFLFSGSRHYWPMLLGAALTGVLTTLLIELLHRRARLQEDASIGIAFTWLFAIGVILISAFTGQVDLDQDCVLYGEIAYVPFDRISLGSLGTWPRALVASVLLLALVIFALWRGFRVWVLSSFQPAYAAALGVAVGFWHLLFMSLVSVTVVFSFEAVGAILIVALLVVPPATAYLLSQRLRSMLALSVGFAWLSAFGGYFLATWLNASIAGAIVTVSGLFFILALALRQKISL